MQNFSLHPRLLSQLNVFMSSKASLFSSNSIRGVGLFAVKTIEPGEILLSVPFSSMIRSEPHDERAGFDHVAGMISIANELEMRSLLGWDVYSATLSSHPFPKECVPTNSASLALERRLSTDGRRKLHDVRTRVKNCQLSDWAIGHAFSRCHIELQPMRRSCSVLIPVLDFVNHSCLPNCATLRGRTKPPDYTQLDDISIRLCQKRTSIPDQLARSEPFFHLMAVNQLAVGEECTYAYTLPDDYHAGYSVSNRDDSLIFGGLDLAETNTAASTEFRQRSAMALELVN